MNSIEDDKITLQIANNLKESRLKKGLTQAELAEKAGMNSNSYAKIERGKAQLKGVTLVKLLKALGVKPTDILPL